MVIAARNEIDIDLEDVKDAVGATSFKRGATYARGGRVLSLDLDEFPQQVSARVIGSGAIYDTVAYFESDGAAVEFAYGECSCPIGYDCKHVAAVVIAAAGGTGRGGLGAAETRSSPASAGREAPGRESGDGERERQPSWDAPLRAMITAPAVRSSGSALAIELSVSFGGAYSGAAPRLHARLMRPGARGGWVNGSLSWGSLDTWDLRSGDYREDHIALARQFQAVHRARLATSSRYYYGYGDHERTLDLSDWEAGQLWPLLDEAARLAVVTIHADGGLGEVPRHSRGELVLNVSATSDGCRVTPALRIDGGSQAGRSPLLFLGSSGHGIVMLADPDVDAGSNGSAPQTRQHGELTVRPLRLVRLARATPAEVQRMVLDGTELTVPAAEVERFATELAPALRTLIPVVSADGSLLIPEVSEPELILRAHHDEDHVTTARWGFRYRVGERTADFPLSAGAEGAGFRDPDAERAILDGTCLAGSALAGLGLLDAEGRPDDGVAVLTGLDTVRFVTEVLPATRELDGLAVETVGEPLTYHDADGSVEIAISTDEIPGERDWFDLNVSIVVDGRQVPLPLLLAALAHGETRMLLEDGTHFSLLAPELSKLRELVEEARALSDGGEQDSLRISRYQAGLWEELVAIGVVGRQAERWRRQVEGLLELDDVPRHEPPSSLTATLRPYQLDGYQWLVTLWQLGLGGILADDMGLGKTLQALALLCHAQERGEAGPFLVLAPTSVVPNWVSEAARFAPELPLTAVSDTFAKSGRTIDEVLSESNVVVTTYTLLRLEADAYASVPWAGVILDEAQQVKNHNGKAHAAVRRLDARLKLAITGTPMENNLTELWALLSITAPGLFPHPKGFTEHYARPIERHRDAERLRRLRQRIKPLVKRRTKELVAAELPAKQEQSLEVELHPRHRKLYDTHLQRERQRILGLLEDYDRNRFSILTGITRLRQLSLHAGLVEDQHRGVPSAKLDALAEQLAEIAAGGHRALVFSQFTGFLAMARERLDADGIAHCYLDGQTRRRDQVITRFKEGCDPVFLISLKAGGFGLNLTEADYCLLLDPWWNPATETQATDRTHRIGQTKPVMVYRMITRDTIEQKVVALAQRKAQLFTGVMDDGDLFAGGITAEDIRSLIA